MFLRFQTAIGGPRTAAPPRTIEAAFKELDAAYGSGERAYHNWHHIEECLEWIDASREGIVIQGVDVLVLAVFYHDAVYVPGAPDNERASVRLAARRLNGIGVGSTFVHQIERLIMRTRHDAPAPWSADAPNDEDARTIVDVDLAILGAPWTRVLEYDRAIRKEYHAVSEEAFREGRRCVLVDFLDRDAIYANAFFASKLEQRARANLTRLVAEFYSLP